MNTQPRKTRAGWLNVGWVTDAELSKEIREFKARMEALGPCTMSHCVKVLLRAGLDAAKQGRYIPRKA